MVWLIPVALFACSAAAFGLPARHPGRHLAGRCTHDAPRWRRSPEHAWRCTRCGHRTWTEITHPRLGVPLPVPPPRTRDLPARAWLPELADRYRARHADVAVPGPLTGRPRYQRVITPFGVGYAEADDGDEAAMPDSACTPPWGDIEQPPGWPVFATSADLEPIWDDRVVPPYVTRGHP